MPQAPARTAREPVQFAEGTNRTRSIEEAKPQAPARRAAPATQVPRVSPATRPATVDEQDGWARSLAMAKARIDGTPVTEPTPRERERPAAPLASETVRVPAPPPARVPAPVIDLAAARAERDRLPLPAPPPMPAAGPATSPGPIATAAPPAPAPRSPVMSPSRPLAPSRGGASHAYAALPASSAAPALAPPAVAPPVIAPPVTPPVIAPPVTPPPIPSAAPPPPVAAPTTADPYAVFEQIGLGAPRPSPAVSQRAQKAVINAYRLLGFGILTIIVLVLVGYIGQSVFYMVSDSWIQPMVVSPTDERVLSLSSQLTEQSNLRDKVALELEHTERFIEGQQEFQAAFVAAVKADLAERRSTLRRLRTLAGDYAGARDQIRKSNRAFAKQSRRRMKQELAAGLIDRSDFLAGSYQLAQIANSNISLAEKQAEFENRAAALESEARALEAILADKEAEGVLSYEVLKVKQEYDNSRLETAKAVLARKALQDSLARHDAIIESIRNSPHLRAAEEAAHVAFVPYPNLDNVSVGAPLYACALDMIGCRQVGVVRDLLPGEVSFKHPVREKLLRGQMVELDLSDADAAAKGVLFVGGKPLLL